MTERVSRTTHQTKTNTKTSQLTKTRTKTKPKIDEKQRISLTGSTTIVSDYFHYALNTILFQRSIYDQNEFKMIKKFGLQMMLIEDIGILEYLNKINQQLKLWLNSGQLSKLVLVIQRKDNGETIERWEFDVTIEKTEEEVENQANPAEDQNHPVDPQIKISKPKSLIEIQNEIQQIIRQIISSVSFLPIFEFPRTFKVLAYTKDLKDDFDEWKDSEAFDITEGSERVKLKSFSTSLHKIDTAVNYKLSLNVLNHLDNSNS
ncbi:DNA-binding protein [Melampsora americana]|nr:DNA-binding protein [Melampsora americana]